MREASVFWFTGLSGSGKTNVANGVKPLLEKKGFTTIIIDGDDVRSRIHAHLGFTDEDIKENNLLIADLCRTFRNGSDVILVSIISPFISSRALARKLIGKKFFEIYFSADLETVVNRDVKGLYSKAKRNEIDNLIGYSPCKVYEPPKRPDFIVNSGEDNVESSINKLYEFIINQLRGL